MPSLTRWFRTPSTSDLSALRQYNQDLDALLARVREIRESWIAFLEFERDAERLANQASVHRWELMRLAQQVDALEAPRLALAAQRDVHRNVSDAARACQMLANGYRFHKSEAVCDGEVLFSDAIAGLDGLTRKLDQALSA